MMFETWIAFEPSKSGILLISVVKSCIFIDFLMLCTSYNQRASNAHNFAANRRELSEENVFGIFCTIKIGHFWKKCVAAILFVYFETPEFTNFQNGCRISSLAQ